MRFRSLATLVVALLALTATAGSAAGEVRGLKLHRIAKFKYPTYVTAAPNDPTRLFVTEHGGVIRIVRNGQKLRRPFLDIRSRVKASWEQGFFSMAFAPDYARSHLFYVYYTANTGDIKIVEFHARGDRGRKRSARVVFTQRHRRFARHNGGQLQFGPDGFLYAGLGDGGGIGDPLENAQDLGTYLGKIIRIDPRGHPYRVPRSNPFYGRAGAKPAIYAYGLRNPWRFSFDRLTGDLMIGDVGQEKWEEISFVQRGEGAGANFGWDAFEGTHRYEAGPASGHVRPVIELAHSDGFCSIVGGYVLRHRSYGRLRGTYVFGDFCDGHLLGARLSPGHATKQRRLGGRVYPLTSFGEDSRGRLYAASLAGPVYRLEPRR